MFSFVLVCQKYSLNVFAAFNHFAMVYFFLRFIHHKGLPLFYRQPILQKRVIYSAYLHQLSCHKILLRNFHFSRGRSSNYLHHHQNTLYKQERNLSVRRLLQNGNCKMMKIVKTRLEKRLPEIFNCLVFCLRSKHLLVCP